MHIGERLWVVVTTFLNFITLSPTATPDGSIVDQTPLRVARPASVPLEAVPACYSIAPQTQGDRKLVFAPPGSSDPDFKCDYSAMEGWEPCSTSLDRKCWLRNTHDGSQIDLYTNYEDTNLTPKGITRVCNLTLTDESYDADGLDFPFAKLFNKQYPGPLIEACWGDTIIVNVTNKLKYNGTSVHWHMDGVNGVTQCPIAPGDSMEYAFNVTQYGTSWYHSHYSVQYADGATGPMTLHGPASDDYDDAVPGLIMTDWGHNSAFNASFNPFTGLDRPSILLNGRGNVSNFGYPNTSVPRPPYSMTFESANSFGAVKRYLIRIMNTSFQKTFIFSIDNHMLEVVSADFVPIVPYRNTTVLVGIGQRYDIIVEARPQMDPDNPSVPLPADNNYWIRTIVSDCNTESGLPNGTLYQRAGILRYDRRNTADPTSVQWQNFSTDCSDESYHSLHPILNWQVGPPSNGREIFTIGFPAQQSYPMAAFNLSKVDIDPSIRVDYRNITFLNLNNTGGWNQSFRVVPEVKTSAKEQWIHLHGHDFAILNQSSVFDPDDGFACGKNLNCDNPPRRDVVLTRGYTVIAFKMDNPGAWLVHCHIAFHIAYGLGMQILEDRAQALALWPPGSESFNESSRVCTNWQTWHDQHDNWWPVEKKENCTGIDQQFGDVDYCFQEDSGV